MNKSRRYRIGVHAKRERSGFIKGMTIAEYYKKRYHDKSTHEQCFKCGRMRHVRMRVDKKAVCPRCYQRYFYSYPKSICTKCGRLKLVAKYTTDGKPVCGSCREKNTGICKMCGKEKIIQAAGLCYGCYKKYHWLTKQRSTS